MRFIECVDDAGLSLNANRIHAGGNSGYQAIGLAFIWGAARIVLLGFDMQKTGGKNHHFGDHAGGLPNLGDLPTWIRRLHVLAIDLRRRGVELINASRETAIPPFIERLPIETALA